jgi:peptidoglycan/LPS O-acetylase OafA/YrhL
MSTILLLVISIVAPWTVHLAPPRQRPLALVGVIAVFLLYGIFASNPLTQWEMWAGLAAGILTVMFLAGGAGGRGGRSSGGSRAPRRPRPRAFEEGNEPTGEL